jgi:hypothetical protein
MVQDPVIYKPRPYSYDDLGNNCTTYASDAWRFYSGEQTGIWWPGLPDNPENWIKSKSRPTADPAPYFESGENFPLVP